jgi:hypothetical protein
VAEVDAVLTSSAGTNARLAFSLHPESAETFSDVRPAQRLDLVLTPSGTNARLAFSLHPESAETFSDVRPAQRLDLVLTPSGTNLPAITVPHQAVRLRLAHAPASGQLVLAWRATNAHSTWSDLAALPLNPTNSSVSNNLAPLWNLNSASKLRINMWGNQ